MAKRPKGKLFALLAIFAAIGLVAASGAFTSVTAERTANVTVAGDGAALLQLEPYDGNNGDDYARLQDGELEISLSGFDGSVDGDGVNLNATTDIQNVFNITNQGSQEVNVNISDAGDGSGPDNSSAVVFYTTNGDHSSSSLANGGLEETDENDIVDAISDSTSGSAVTLSSGDTVEISIYIDTTATELPPLSQGSDLVEEITINATESSA